MISANVRRIVMEPILPLIHPVPIVVIGTQHPAHPEPFANYTTVGDVAIAGLRPPLVMISLHEQHLSRESVDAFGRFSINLPTSDFLAKVDLCGMVSGRDCDKSGVFEAFWVDGVPCVSDMPISLVCRVTGRLQVEKRVIFVARVEKIHPEGDIDLEKISGIQYGLDNRYYGTGKPIGTGYREGNSLLEALREIQASKS